MFQLALLIGIYSYTIFFLGINSLLSPLAVYICSIIFIFFCIVLYKKILFTYIFILFHYLKQKNTKIERLIVILITIQLIVNFIGVLGPELAFDALWYHLTLPKLYILHQSIYHIPGGLLYYSDMPKLGEMLYIGALTIGNEIVAKCIHYLFSLLILASVYKFSRFYFNRFISLVTVLILVSNLVFSWESTTAYIDLIRTFFEFLSLWAFLIWWREQKIHWLLLSGTLLGLAITTKLLAIGSLFLIILLLFYSIYKRKLDIKYYILYPLYYFFSAFIIPLPWLIFSYIHTGNPVYPFFSSLYTVEPMHLNIVTFISDIFILFTQAADPISPLYIIIIPLVILFYKNLSQELKLLVIYSCIAIIIWYFTPRTGGGRFILPYLPVFSVIAAGVIHTLYKAKLRYYYYLLVFIVIAIGTITIFYRTAAELKYLPVLVGLTSKHDFLSNNLNYSYGDFYDTEKYFENNIKQNEVVLLYGFHNLYYVDFAFIDASWVKKGDRFTYIATQNTELPERYNKWELIYENPKTLVKLYKPSHNDSCNVVCTY